MSQLPHTPLVSALAIGSVLVCTTGCPSADPEGKYERFLEETQDERDEAMDMKMDVSGALADISGTHLFALAAVIDTAKPLQFIVTVDLTTTPEGGTMTTEFQPLSLDVGSTTEPREPVGEALVFSESPVDAGGGFTVDLGEVSVVGAANPITGSDIVATLTVEGAIQDENLWCGRVTGMVSSPLTLDLEGSTFAAVRIEGTDPASLPTDVLASCPMGGDEGGSGESGSGGDADTDTATSG